MMAGAAPAQEFGALVVVESMWGNTRAVAQAVANGLSESVTARVIDVTDAPATLGERISLLVVGGPTHAFSMSRASTRDNPAIYPPVDQLDRLEWMKDVGRAIRLYDRAWTELKMR